MLSKHIHKYILCLTCLLSLVLLPLPLQAAEKPPPDIASYTLDVTYDPETHTLTGYETAVYYNRTDEPIPDLIFHLYLNAFRSENTVWLQESGMGHRGFGYDPAYPGWVEIEQMTLVAGEATTALEPEPVDMDETLVRADLPQPVEPDGSMTVNITFTAQLPKVFARTGWADEGDFVMAGQWFPKFGVWEDGAWDAYAFHANSEFYADFGTYEVNVTLPEGWVVGATGEAVEEPSLNETGTETHSFRAEHVIDFAWAASPHFGVKTRDVDGVTLRVVYAPERKRVVPRVLDATEGALRLYSEWYGPYGQGLYSQLTVILPPPDASGAGGMEYPTLFTVGALGGANVPACVRLLEVETIHELGHQWFQSVIATNEAEDPWMDEGFTDYSAVRAMAALYPGGIFDCLGWPMSYLTMRRLEYLSQPDVPMFGKAWDFGNMDYGVATYSKPAVALSTLERVVGEKAMAHFLYTYADRYAFAHPTTDDVREVMVETLGTRAADWFFDGAVYDDAVLDAYVVQLEGNEARVERRGDLCIPNDVRVTYARGTPVETMWLCEDSTLSFSGSDPVAAVEIDPEGEVLMDLNRVDNGLRSTLDVPAWLGVVVRMVHLLETLVFVGGAAW